MTLVDMGRKKKEKHIKCKKCNSKIDLVQEEIETIDGHRSIWCPKCGTENVLKR